MKRYYFLVLLVLCFACQKIPGPPDTGKQDAAPPRYVTIAELLQRMGNGVYVIHDDLIISGVVIADDRNGNFYKQIIIDDGTAALPILIDAYNLYNDFPVGRNVYLKCKELVATKQNNLPQLGFSLNEQGNLNPIPAKLVPDRFLPGSYDNKFTPIKVSLKEAVQLKTELLNRLIALPEVQINDTAADHYFALPPELASVTVVGIGDCDHHVIQMRTSAYCIFRASLLPQGNGTLIAIYSVYNNTPQLIIRAAQDLQFNQTRCP